MEYLRIGERFTSFYGRRALLRHLEKVGADIIHNEVCFLSGDFHVGLGGFPKRKICCQAGDGLSAPDLTRFSRSGRSCRLWPTVIPVGVTLEAVE